MASNFYVKATRGNTIRLLANLSRNGVAIPVSSVTNVWFRALGGGLNILKTMNNGISTFNNNAGQVLIVIEDTETAGLQKNVSVNSSLKILENDGTYTTVSRGIIEITLDEAEAA